MNDGGMFTFSSSSSGGGDDDDGQICMNVIIAAKKGDDEKGQVSTEHHNYSPGRSNQGSICSGAQPVLLYSAVCAQPL